MNQLLPGDKVLADRGLDIQESVGLLCAEVKLPIFTSNQRELSDAEGTKNNNNKKHLHI